MCTVSLWCLDVVVFMFLQNIDQLWELDFFGTLAEIAGSLVATYADIPKSDPVSIFPAAKTGHSSLNRDCQVERG